LKFKFPELAKQWHPTKNKTLNPGQFAVFSNKSVWWYCSVTTCDHGCPHEWRTAISTRQQTGCPFCSIPAKQICEHNSLQARYPELTNEWHPTKNENLKPDQFSVSSGQQVWWICRKFNCHQKCLHEWRTSINNRTGLSRGCPFCSIPAKRICEHNSLQARYPEIANEWHPTENENLKPNKFSVSSNKIVWWQCLKKPNHRPWFAAITSRTSRKTGCPTCRTSHMEIGMLAVVKRLQSQPTLFSKRFWILVEVQSQCRSVCPGLIADFKLGIQYESKKHQAVIEVDRIQHFDQIDFFGEDNLIKTQSRDLRKEQLCIANYVHLLRISYDVKEKDYEAIVCAFIDRIIEQSGNQTVVQKVGAAYHSSSE